MKKGDEVSVLDEDLVGIVKKIQGNEVLLDVDGFEMHFDKSELVVTKSFRVDYIEEENLTKILEEKSQHTKPKIIPKRKKSKEESIYEIDLHIQKLVKSTRGMSKHDMLTKQIEVAQNRLEYAIENKIQRMVFIHGVGDGVLRMELEYLLNRYPEVNYFDANFKKYGVGATEVYIYKNPKKSYYS